MRNAWLLKADIVAIARPLAPYLPCLGMPSEGTATSKHVFNCQGKTVNDIIAKGHSNITEKDSG